MNLTSAVMQADSTLSGTSFPVVVSVGFSFRLVDMSQLGDFDKGRIIALYEDGYSISAISRALGYSKSTVHLWVKRMGDEGHVNCRRRSGRPRSTTEVEDQSILRCCDEDPFRTSTEIKNILKLNVSRSTIRRRLNKEGRHGRKSAVKEMLKDQHKVARLRFALAYRSKPLSYWDRVIFTDEKVFSTAPNSSVHVYRPSGLRFNRKYVQQRQRCGRTSVTVWGWISANGCGVLWELDRPLTSAYYCKILEDIMLPSVRHRFQSGCVIYQHDLSPVHTAKRVKQWFQMNEDIELLNWPPKGADLNPIEHVWAEMEKIIRSKRPAPTSKAALSQAVHDAWEELSQNSGFIKKIVASVPRRLNAVVEEEGNWTRY